MERDGGADGSSAVAKSSSSPDHNDPTPALTFGQLNSSTGVGSGGSCSLENPMEHEKPHQDLLFFLSMLRISSHTGEVLVAKELSEQ
ncbi:uncharacterized protein [Narcine bancroftii]|uniref:uncharacterized protein isoform X6 n=1 Tax=Narcine bancroftii TaxID=1343680 RepID=UPI0038320B51